MAPTRATNEIVYSRDNYKRWPWSSFVMAAICIGSIFFMAGSPSTINKLSGAVLIVAICFLAMGTILLVPSVSIIIYVLVMYILQSAGCTCPSCCHKPREWFKDKNKSDFRDDKVPVVNTEAAIWTVEGDTRKQSEVTGSTRSGLSGETQTTNSQGDDEANNNTNYDPNHKDGVKQGVLARLDAASLKGRSSQSDASDAFVTRATIEQSKSGRSNLAYSEDTDIKTKRIPQSPSTRKYPISTPAGTGRDNTAYVISVDEVQPRKSSPSNTPQRTRQSPSFPARDAKNYSSSNVHRTQRSYQLEEPTRQYGDRLTPSPVTRNKKRSNSNEQKASPKRLSQNGSPRNRIPSGQDGQSGNSLRPYVMTSTNDISPASAKRAGSFSSSERPKKHSSGSYSGSDYDSEVDSHFEDGMLFRDRSGNLIIGI